MPVAEKTLSTQVTFKLDDTWARLLQDDAANQGLSPNIAAREHLFRALKGDRSELSAVRDEVASLRAAIEELRLLVASVEAARSAEAKDPGDALRELRLDFATAVAAMLAELRPQASSEEIASWVKANLLRKE